MVSGFRLGKTEISQISRSELSRIRNESIKEWHFERSEDGRSVKPVEGKYDPTNPKHDIYPKKHITILKEINNYNGE